VTKKKSPLAIAILLSVSVVVTLSGCIRVVSQVSSTRDFDPLEWKAHPERDQNETVRSEMAEDLVDRSLTKGEPRSKVIALIGLPTWTFGNSGPRGPVFLPKAMETEDRYTLSKLDSLWITYDGSQHLVEASIR
jgi:hypothetical protein